MSANKKLSGNSEVARLKELWRDSFDEPQREYWRSRFLSRDTQAVIRAELKQKLAITLLYDNQLNVFRDWADDQLKQDIEAERQADDLRRIAQEHPDWSEDQRRKKAFDLMYHRAMNSGDWKLLQGAMKLDKGFMEVSIDHRKLAILEAEAAKAQQAKEVINSTLTPEEQRARLKDILK